MSDRQLIADLLSALEYHTEQTRPIEFSKVAIEAAREYLRKPEQPAQQEPVCIGYWNQKTGAYYKPDQVSAAHKKLIEDGILRLCYTSQPPAQPEQPAHQESAPLLPEVDICMRAEAHGIDASTPGLYGFYVDCMSSSPQPAQQEPVAFLANGTRFKISFFENEDGPGTYVTCFEAFEKELDGRWVALVAAEDDCHRSLTRPQAREPLTDRVIECAKRLVEHADFQLGGVLSADSKAKDIPSRAVSQVKARHLAALRDALAAHGIGEQK